MRAGAAVSWVNARLCRVGLLLVFGAAAGSLTVWAQTAAGATGAGPKGAGPTTSGQSPGATQTPATSEAKPLAGPEATALLASVDEILGFASRDSALPIRGAVGRRLVSRDEVMAYLQQHLAEDKDTERLKRSELVLKKFGLLPREFQLEPFLLRLLREQIAGYYDDKTKTVNLLNWVGEDEQRPVLAHELTHALQDQAVGLERWSDSGVHGLVRTGAEEQEHLRTDELETARSAVAEGQAMLVFLDYSLRSTGKTLEDSPGIVDRLLTADAKDDSSPVLAQAPPVLQDSLLFPYTDGLRFEAALLKAGGKREAFADALARPPSSSWEVMNPAAYLAQRSVPTLALPDLTVELQPQFRPYDVGVMGALDVRVMAETYTGAEDGKALAAGWNGGAYFAAERATGTAKGTGTLALAYVSRWTDEGVAQRFASVYEAGLGRKYAQLVREPAESSGMQAACVDTWFGSEEGEVLVARCGRSVVVTEGFARVQAERLRREMLLINERGLQAKTPSAAPWSLTVPGRGLTASLMTAAPAHYTLLRRLKPGHANSADTRGEAH